MKIPDIYTCATICQDEENKCLYKKPLFGECEYKILLKKIVKLKKQQNKGLELLLIK